MLERRGIGKAQQQCSLRGVETLPQVALRCLFAHARSDESRILMAKILIADMTDFLAMNAVRDG
jgi:hypothetical protein